MKDRIFPLAVLIGVFFLKFWRRTRHAFFGYFAFAFFTLKYGDSIYVYLLSEWQGIGAASRLARD